MGGQASGGSSWLAAASASSVSKVEGGSRAEALSQTAAHANRETGHQSQEPSAGHTYSPAHSVAAPKPTQTEQHGSIDSDNGGNETERSCAEGNGHTSGTEGLLNLGGGISSKGVNGLAAVIDAKDLPVPAVPSSNGPSGEMHMTTNGAQ